jgi:hypothetical protein
MLGSTLNTTCFSCLNCCPNSNNSPNAENELLPNQIHFEYSAVPSFIEPNFGWDTTYFSDNPGDSNSSEQFKTKRTRTINHPVVSWNGILDRVVINGEAKAEYFKYFELGNRPEFTVSGQDIFTYDEWVQTGSPFDPWEKQEKTITVNINKTFEIVAAYVAQIKIQRKKINIPSTDLDNLTAATPIEFINSTGEVLRNPDNCPTHNCCIPHHVPGGCGNELCVRKEFKDNINPKCLNSQGLPVTGSCYVERQNGNGGCDTPECCSFVCSEKPECCIALDETETVNGEVITGTGWDAGCAELAEQNCAELCGGPEVTLSGQPGFISCKAAVCAADPVCCEKQWDIACVSKAVELGCCPDYENSRFEVRSDDAVDRGNPVNISGYAWFADIVIQPKNDFTFIGSPVLTVTGQAGFPTADASFKTYISDASTNKQIRFTSVKKIDTPINNPNEIYYDVISLEDFLDTPDSSKRHSILIPKEAQVNEVKSCLVNPTYFQPEMPHQTGFIKPYAKEFIDEYYVLDPCNPQIVPTVYPSSPIRDNKNQITRNLVQNNFKLPYGVYKLNITPEAYSSKIPVCPCNSDCDPRWCQRPCDCYTPSSYPGCPCNSDFTCEFAVCDIMPSCCQTSWDTACVALAQQLPACSSTSGPSCGDPFTGPCTETRDTPFCDDLGCCQTICAFNPSCCEQAWGSECVKLAEFFCGSGTTPPNNLVSQLVTSTPTNPLPRQCEPYSLWYADRQNDNVSPDIKYNFTQCEALQIYPYYFNSPAAGGVKSPREIVPNIPQYLMMDAANINFRCGYDFLKTPSCIFTERQIDSMFVSMYLPELPEIRWFVEDSTSLKLCSAYGSGIPTVPCPLPKTNFSKLIKYSDALFASSATIIIRPVTT